MAAAVTETEHLVQVTAAGAKPFCAVLVMRDDKCIAAAPILRWTKGKSRAFLRDYFARQGWAAKIIQTTVATL